MTNNNAEVRHIAVVATCQRQFESTAILSETPKSERKTPGSLCRATQNTAAGHQKATADRRNNHCHPAVVMSSKAKSRVYPERRLRASPIAATNDSAV